MLGRARNGARLACLATVLAGGATAVRPPLFAADAPAVREHPAPALRWLAAGGKSSVEIAGLDAATLQQLRQPTWTAARWRELLAVYVESENPNGATVPTPMLGRHAVDGTTLRFDPQFPLDAGATYRAIFRPEHLGGTYHGDLAPLSAVFRVPSTANGPATIVSEVYPSSNTLPENLLKFYVHFSAPMSGGRIYEHFHLRNAAGKDVVLPFLELDEELWNPEMTRLTLLLDPGRIKREVRPLVELGPALEAGRRFTLVIDREWKDSVGRPLREAFSKSFEVVPPDRTPPDPAKWTVISPAAGSFAPLSVDFPEPMDRALAQRLIHVTTGTGAPVDGKIALTAREQRWEFIPTAPWQRGSYRLVVATTIEDLAGNNVGKQFDVDLFDHVQRDLSAETVKLPFAVR